MNTFAKPSDDRIAFDQDRAFKARARGVKLLGLWAAERQGLSGEAAQTYARSLVIADFEEAGDDDILRVLLPDLEPMGVTRAELIERLSACIEHAATLE